MAELIKTEEVKKIYNIITKTEGIKDTLIAEFFQGQRSNEWVLNGELSGADNAYNNVELKELLKISNKLNGVK